MCPKKRRNTVSYPLTPYQRLALWSSVDLLRFVKGGSAPTFSIQTIESVCYTFELSDGDNNTYEFEFTASHHRVCSYALKYALLYLSGEFHYFDLPIPERIDSEIKEFEPYIRFLAVQFKAN